MSGSYVLDTNLLLSLIRGQALGAKIDEAFGLTSTLHRQIVSIVTQAELWVIADRNGWGGAKRSALQHALGMGTAPEATQTNRSGSYTTISQDLI